MHEFLAQFPVKCSEFVRVVLPEIVNIIRSVPFRVQFPGSVVPQKNFLANRVRFFLYFLVMAFLLLLLSYLYIVMCLLSIIYYFTNKSG